MAFQFVPPFVEGDKQTNPDTGIEYIYHDGAWRHLGAKIEDEFDSLDERYVNDTGDTMSGYLHFQGNRGIKFDKDDGSVLGLFYRASDTNVRTNINQGGSWSLYCKNEDDSSQNTMIKAQYKPGDSAATLNLYHVADPTNDTHAANRKYVDDKVAGVSSNKPPGRLYKYSNSYGNSLPSGCFHIEGGGTVQISRYDHDGVEIATTYSNDWKASVKGVVTVRTPGGTIKHAQAFDHFYQGKDNSKHISINRSTTIKDGKSNMTAGDLYYIADGIYCM